MINFAITLAIIATMLGVTYVGGAVALVAVIFGGLILTCKIDPKGLNR
jgi:hypothetical protein